MRNPIHKNSPTRKKSAFTLVELLLAMSILALVMVSVFSMVDVVTVAYTKGMRSMEMYQTARVALTRVSEELKFALSSYAFWRPPDRYELLPFEQVMAEFGGRVVREEEPGPIIFQGSSDSVTFVKKVYQFGVNPPFDLQQCTIQVNEFNQLILRKTRSLLQVKRMSWLYRSIYETPLQGLVFDMGGQRARFRPMGPMMEEIPMDQFIGDFGRLDGQYVIAENVKEIKFQYTDGGSYQQGWDSTKLVKDYRRPPQSQNFNLLTDVQMRDLGPPQVVEISITMLNNESLVTATDIPAGNMKNLGGFFSGGGLQSGGFQQQPGANNLPGSESGTTVPGIPGMNTLIPFAGGQ